MSAPIILHRVYTKDCTSIKKSYLRRWFRLASVKIVHLGHGSSLSIENKNKQIILI